jgi:hypothetical protein
VVEALMLIYERTQHDKYLDAVSEALDYLQKSETADRKLARFYELETNRPLFFTRDYVLTYDDADVPTHYSFWVPSRVAKLNLLADYLTR